MQTVPESLAIAYRHHQEGRLNEAEQICRQVLLAEPQNVDAWRLLGVMASQTGRHDAAIECIQRALQIRPDWAEGYCRLGDAFYDFRRLDEAVACYSRALRLNPDFAPAHYNMGAALKDQGKLDGAAACFRRALKLNPDFVEAQLNLGYVLQQQGNLGEAFGYYQQVLKRRPDFVEAHNNLGLTFLEQGKLDEAGESFRRALELDPQCADAHCNHSFVLLTKGDFKQGWPEYEWRWKTGVLRSRKYERPEWDGHDLRGKTILLHVEQGLGDTLQFIRYVSLVKQLGATVFVECQKPLLPLLASCPDIDQLIGHGDKLPCYDVHAALLSLPGKFQTSLEKIPAKVPYLFPDAALVADWRTTLQDVHGFRIGVNWHGRVGRRDSQQRDIPLRCFASIAKLPGVTLVNLQKGGHQELNQTSSFLPILDLGESVDQGHGAFMDTAAIMANLDLIITSDTSIPHLAGALGVPVWVALPFAADWRWLLDRRDSPWYPTMRLFRQKRPGDWAGVFEEMRDIKGGRAEKGDKSN